MRDGDVFEGDVELRGPFEQVGPDPRRHGFSLGDEFGGVELRHDGFEDFVADGGQDALVVVEAEGLVDWVLVKRTGEIGNDLMEGVGGQSWVCPLVGLGRDDESGRGGILGMDGAGEIYALLHT